MPTSSRCLLGIMKMCSLCRLCGVALALCQSSDPRNNRIAQSPNRLGAHFDRIANREALPRDWARFRQPWRAGQSPAAGPALAAGPERLKEGCTRRHSVRERQPALLSSPLEEEPRAAQHLAD